jgi:tetratricopeptide (TPR) repeat protein
VSIGLAEALWLRVRDQPAESNDRLSAAHTLANSLYKQGKYEEAAQMQRELLEVQRRVLGAEHPHTLHTTGSLASTLYAQGAYEEAAQMQRGLLEVQRRVLGAEHPRTLATKCNLAISLFEQGAYEEAAQMQRELLEVRRRVPGPSAEHHDPTPRSPRRMLPDSQCSSNLGGTLLGEFESNKRRRQY